MNDSIGVSNTAASVIAYRTTVFPSFWLSEYAHSIDWSVQSAVEVAATHLHLTGYSFIDAIAPASVISRISTRDACLPGSTTRGRSP